MKYFLKIVLITFVTLGFSEARANTLFDSLKPRVKVTTKIIFKKYFIFMI